MNLSNSEMKLMEIIWREAPVKSGEIAAQALRDLNWKKSTVYTVLKKLTLKGAISSKDAVVTPLCTRDDILGQRSGELIQHGFSGSLPSFLAAFLKKEKLTVKEAEALKKLIDDYTESEEK